MYISLETQLKLVQFNGILYTDTYLIFLVKPETGFNTHIQTTHFQFFPKLCFLLKGKNTILSKKNRPSPQLETKETERL